MANLVSIIGYFNFDFDIFNTQNGRTHIILVQSFGGNNAESE
jgi:hypothetical protein